MITEKTFIVLFFCNLFTVNHIIATSDFIIEAPCIELWFEHPLCEFV